jgi:hypothetical protein
LENNISWISVVFSLHYAPDKSRAPPEQGMIKFKRLTPLPSSKRRREEEKKDGDHI